MKNNAEKVFQAEIDEIFYNLNDLVLKMKKIYLFNKQTILMIHLRASKRFGMSNMI